MINRLLALPLILFASTAATAAPREPLFSMPRAGVCPPGTLGPVCVVPPEETTPPPGGGTGCQGTTVPEGQSVQAAIDGAAEGATLCIAGLHRVEQPIHPKTRQVLQGDTGAVLSGAIVITGWQHQGSAWVAQGRLGAAPPDEDRCEVAGCRHVNDVFSDGHPLRRVMSTAQLVTGTYYNDYGQGRIFLHDNPSGHLIEQSLSDGVVTGTAQGVHLQGLLVEMSANPEQKGMIDCQGGSGWVIDHLDIRYGHGVGIECDAFTMRNSHVHHNGQMGMGGHGQHILIEGNEVDHNNIAGYDDGWEGGGSKFAAGSNGTEHGIMRGNDVHDNNGAGLWCDINCYDWTIENNHVWHNRAQGIFYEISHTCKVLNNTLEGNAWEFSDINGMYTGSDILISASPDCEVAGNTSANYAGIGGLQQDRAAAYGSGNACDFNGSPTTSDGKPWCVDGHHVLTGLNVHDNHINGIAGDSMLAGISQDWNGSSAFQPAANNRFTNNTYGKDRYFTWNNVGFMTEAEWNAAGQH